MKERKRVRKRAGFNLFGQYLQHLYRVLGISSDRELAEKSGVHQTTISTIKRTHRASAQTVERLLQALRTYPGWREEYTHDLFVAADRAIPEERDALSRQVRHE